MSELIMAIGGLFGGLGVILGAFAAHGLKNKLSLDMQAVFKTGVEYQFYHSFALAMVGLSLMAQNIDNSQYLTWAFYSFSIGIIFFSGSLYLLAITRKKIFGPITPIGGLFLMMGWVFFTLHWMA